MPDMLIDQPSVQSLFLLAHGLRPLGSGTGFVVFRPDGSPLLITNWHVLAGRNPGTRQPVHPSGATPTTVRIAHNVAGEIGQWIWREEQLLDPSGEPRWLEHPTHRAAVDVVGLPLEDLGSVALYPYSYDGPTGHGATELPEPLKWGPSEYVNIIGFPFGWTAGGSIASNAFGIWVQGAVASEPELDYEGLPRFLIDSRTRSGQSGSPVVLYKRNGWVTLSGGRPYMLHNSVTLLLGVYSGRLSADSDLGTVWRTSVVAEIARSGVVGSLS